MMNASSFDPWSAALGQRSIVGAKGSELNNQALISFEALLIRQFLTAAKSTSWLSDANEAESGWREIADDALAGHIARVGGLGLAKQLNSLLSQVKKARSDTNEPTSIGQVAGDASTTPFNGFVNRSVTTNKAAR